MPHLAARNLITTHWNGTIPVDPFALALAALPGVEFRTITPFTPGFDGVSGMAEIDAQGQRVIYYAHHEVPVRQRFTVAHELGHHVLGHVTPEHPQCRDTTNTFSASTWQPIETQANRFAAELLMPESAIEWAIRSQPNATIERLATMFAVSEVAMKFRLKNLGWIYE